MENDLTREQIEAEGWAYIYTKGNAQVYTKGVFKINYFMKTKEIEYFKKDPLYAERHYPYVEVTKGTCPDLITFKYLNKRLDV